MKPQFTEQTIASNLCQRLIDIEYETMNH